MPPIRTSSSTPYLPTYSELFLNRVAAPSPLLRSPRVLSSFEAGCTPFSPQAPGKRDTQAVANILECPPQMWFIEHDPDWEYAGHARGLRDIELYRHIPGIYPAIMIVSVDNVIVIQHERYMTLYSPSTVMDLFMYAGMSCMVFLRSMFMVKYKGIYKASEIDARHFIPYSTLSPAEQDQIVEMATRISVPAKSESVVRNEYATGTRQLNAAKLDYVRWRVDVRLGLDMFTRAAVIAQARTPSHEEARPSTPTHLIRGLRIADPDRDRDASPVHANATAAQVPRRSARVRTRSTPAAGALLPRTARAKPQKARPPPAAKEGKPQEFRFVEVRFAEGHS